MLGAVHQRTKLFEQTRNNIPAGRKASSKAASEGIKNWIDIHGISWHSTETFHERMVLQFNLLGLKQVCFGVNFDDIFLGTQRWHVPALFRRGNLTVYDPRQRPWYLKANAAGKQIITTCF
ncbi:hypothetical protein OH492_08735 [Vibrio chagasii]|nr:hypothetical protein [Vibrio chagasii]